MGESKWRILSTICHLPSTISERFFGARDALDPRIFFTGIPEGSGEAFEDGLGDVVAVAAVEELDVDVGAQVRS